MDLFCRLRKCEWCLKVSVGAIFRLTTARALNKRDLTKKLESRLNKVDRSIDITQELQNVGNLFLPVATNWLQGNVQNEDS